MTIALLIVYLPILDCRFFKDSVYILNFIFQCLEYLAYIRWPINLGRRKTARGQISAFCGDILEINNMGILSRCTGNY